jgi:SpoVK/Ycf46/Vps4 family AAA+-type ATPase
LDEILAAASEGKGAVLLEGNTGDRLIASAAGLPRPANVETCLYQVAAARGFHCGRLSFVQGFQPIFPPGTEHHDSPFPIPHGVPHQDPAGYFAALVPALLSTKHPVALVVNAADLALPEGETGMLSSDQLHFLDALIEVAANDAFRASGNVLALISVQGSVNAALRRSGAFRRISVPLPPETMRQEFVAFLRAHARFGATVPADLSDEELARATNGCRISDIEGLSRRCLATKTSITLDAVIRVKAQAVEDLSHGQLGVVTPTRTMADVIGSGHLKRFADYQHLLAQAGSKEMPAIVILLGVPGTGKTHLVQAYADEIGWLLLEWRNMRSKWVGESEARTEEALRLVTQNAPCIVHVDEVDQLLGGRNTSPGDGGVDARIFASILTATGDAAIRGKVQWLMTTNRPDLLDAALLDRAGERIPFFTPSAGDRALLIAHIAGQVGRTLGGDVNVGALAASPKLAIASIRNLYEIVSMAGRHADTQAGAIGTKIEGVHLERAVQEFAGGDPLEITFIALTALSHIRFSEQLPWIGPDGARLPGVEVPPYLTGVLDPVTGYIDPPKLAASLRQIEGQRRSTQATR